MTWPFLLVWAAWVAAAPEAVHWPAFRGTDAGGIGAGAAPLQWNADPAAGVEARALRGAIASSQGRATMAPRPRNTVRREISGWGMSNLPFVRGSGREEQVGEPSTGRGQAFVSLTNPGRTPRYRPGER